MRRLKRMQKAIAKGGPIKDNTSQIIKTAHPNVKRYWSKTLKRWVTIPESEGRE